MVDFRVEAPRNPSLRRHSLVSPPLSNAVEVDNDSLDAVALAFNLGLEALHLVAIEGVGDIAADIDSSHGCGGEVFFYVKGASLLFVKRTDVYRKGRKTEEGRKRHAVDGSLR